MGNQERDVMPGKVIYYFFDVKSIRNPIEEMLSQIGWKLSLVTQKGRNLQEESMVLVLVTKPFFTRFVL
jgi:hypothetical protein